MIFRRKVMRNITVVWWKMLWKNVRWWSVWKVIVILFPMRITRWNVRGMEVGLYIRIELPKPLRDYITERNLTNRDVIQMGIDLCMGLVSCQKFNILHRDIKLKNIFVSETGSFKLGDFVISRVLSSSEIVMSKKAHNYIWHWKYDSVKWLMKKLSKEKSLRWTLKTVNILGCGRLT